MFVKELYIHPVKSLGGIRVEEFELTSTGAKGDRQWMVVTPDGEFMTQRKYASMCLISTALSEAHDHPSPLHLSHPESGSIAAPRGGGASLDVRVWNDSVRAEDCGDEVAAWLSATLDKSCRLAYMPIGAERAVPDSTSTVGFADAYPLLLCNEASLNDFNQQLPFPIGMNRFRPNIVVAGADEWAEDSWSSLTAGENALTVNSPCTRCVMPSIDPDTGEKQMAVIDALNKHRRFGTETRFGVNASFAQTGRLKVGDPVSVVS